MINWSELYKIRIANHHSKMQHHEVVKILLVMKLLENHKRNKNFIRIYTEFEIESNGKKRKCDIFYENLKTKETYCFEIQKNINEAWLIDAKDFYKDYDRMFFRTCDLILIDLKKLSKNIDELNKQLGEFIV